MGPIDIEGSICYTRWGAASQIHSSLLQILSKFIIVIKLLFILLIVVSKQHFVSNLLELFHLSLSVEFSSLRFANDSR
jgi:hypothetical protein